MPRSRREKRARDANATRGILLDAAAQVFAESGFSGARVDEIAARARVNKALIYAYFGDKRGLYRAVLSSRLGTPALPAGPDPEPRQALEQLVRWYFRLLVEDRAFARLLAWDLLSDTDQTGDTLVESASPALENVKELIRRAQAAGALDADVRPEVFRAAVIALGIGYALQHRAMETVLTRAGVAFTDDDFIEYACGLLLRRS